MPMPPESEPQGIRPPVEVIASFWCWLAAAAINVVAALLRFGEREQLIDALRTSVRGNANRPLTEGQLQQLATITIVVATVIAVVIALLYVLFAVKARAGRNWARIVLAIIAVLELISLVSARGGSTLLGYASEIIAVVAAVLLFAGKANEYFAVMKQRR